ncbi:MAG: hypothetical protein JSS61_02005 [Verrucomicrobia bacterium]|nr:hypothetical protein [Verrucomicrobiota bacterium]
MENELQLIKDREGKTSAAYLNLKQRLQEIRLVHLPFRTYVMWKNKDLAFPKRSALKGKNPQDKQLRQQIKKELLNQVSSPRIQENLNLLSQITFLHGSNSSALVMILLSGQIHLQCTGALLQQGIAPMSGEINEGIRPTGVNMTRISCETIRDIPRIMSYTQLHRFHADQFIDLTHPWHRLLPDSDLGIPAFTAQLQQWKILDPTTYETARLIDAIKLKKNPHLKSLQKQLERGEEFPIYEELNEDWEWRRLRRGITDPHYSNTEYQRWNELAVKLIRLKQWDGEAFEKYIPPLRDKWLERIESVRQEVEKPLKSLIDLIEKPLTDEEATSPDSDFTIPTLKIRLLEYGIAHEDYFKKDLMAHTIAAKSAGRQDLLDEMKPLYLQELAIVEARYHLFRQALTQPPTIRIPDDERLRSLITDPIPLIFASTTIHPSPYGLPGKKPYEYVVDGPIPLGAQGCNLLFTNTLKAKERLEAALPTPLKEEITIHLFDRLDANGVPLAPAPFQIT